MRKRDSKATPAGPAGVDSSPSADEAAGSDAPLHDLLASYANDAILLFDEEFRLVDCNERALDMYGYARDEIMTLSLPDLRVAEQPISLEERMHEIRSRDGLVFESVGRRRDGSAFPIETSVRSIQADGADYYHTVVRDITVRAWTREALRASQRVLETAESVAHVGSWRWDLRTRRASWSDEMFRLFGVDPATFDGDAMALLAERVHPDDWDVLHANTPAVCDSGKTVPVEYRVLLPDGTERILRGEGCTELSKDGEPVAIVGYYQDFTERRRSEKALSESEQRFRGYFEQGLIGAVVTSPEKGWIEVNQAFCDLLGYAREELLRTKWDELTHPDDLAADVAQFDRVLAREIDDYRLEKRFFRKDGRVVHVEISVSAVRRPDGSVDHMIGLVSDLTARRAAEQALRESEEQYRRIVETASEGIIVGDADYRVRFYNRRFAEIIGYELAEMIGKPIATWLFPEDRRVHESETRRRRRGAPSRYERRFRRKDGSAIWVLMSAAPILEPDGSFGGSLAMVTDISDLKAAEQGLKAAVTGTVRAMGALIETRDPYTAGHERRVAEAARAIARELGLGAATVESIGLAAEMHDVGKIAVPAEILSRPARLSEVEFTLIKEHPRVAYKILAPIDFDFPVADIIVQHHERLDGSGYPDGLSGDRILREAQILAVADVVEAMSSHRPYRPALGIDAAMDEIRQGAGVKYDAEVAAALERAVEHGFEFTD